MKTKNDTQPTKNTIWSEKPMRRTNKFNSSKGYKIFKGFTKFKTRANVNFYRVQQFVGGKLQSEQVVTEDTFSKMIQPDLVSGSIYWSKN